MLQNEHVLFLQNEHVIFIGIAIRVRGFWGLMVGRRDRIVSTTLL